MTGPTTTVPVRNGAPADSREPRIDKRLAILLAAEKLFAQHGYNGVSIRDIAAEAEVPLALVRYYYGAKHELHFAIFRSWLPSIEQRLAGLRAATAEPGAPDLLVRIIDAFVAPVLAMHGSEQGRYFALMAARDAASPTDETRRAEQEFFDPMARAFIDALHAACPAATRGQVAWCYQFALGAMLHYMISTDRLERLSDGQARPGDPMGKELLVRFIACGFSGALPATAAPTKTRRTSK